MKIASDKEGEKNKNFYWGLKPNSTLESFINSIPKGNALDLGGGEGRNSFFLAQKGFAVEIVDKNEQFLEKCRDFANEHELSIQISLSDIRQFDFVENKYSLIISTAALDFLKKSEIEILVEKMKKSLIKNGFIFLMIFSTKDPMYQEIIKRGLEEIEENTFYLPKFKINRHFFTEEELRGFFKDFNITFLNQKKIEDTGHGEPHFHDVIELLAQKVN